MGSGLIDALQLAQALGQGEVGPRRRGIDLEELLEHLASPVVLAAVLVGPAKRLEDRALARLGPGGSLEEDRRLGVVATSNQRVAALEQAVDTLALVICESFLVHAKNGATDQGTTSWRANPRG